ncbi:MAG: 1-deoxy-D-xylulose-5-phosphate reductoisomerase [Acidobacteriales bacterium 13_1_40CM_3_55_5]|nr:MAG: 1-deoxy-D-xylulose-5-phosphate reductoisomerase [Acidobacteriales bacterium 13_1_40CM_3_55_5]
MRSISILGSTGSIGRSTLNVVESYPGRFQIVALAAGRNLETALQQVQRWKPRLVSVAAEKDAETLRKSLKASGVSGVEVAYGSTGTVRVATHPDADFVVSAIVGVAGLEATYEAVRAGKTVGLANKECMVAAGELITAEARRQGKPLLPIDSEHNAVHQCLRGGRIEEVERIWLTASGGPFRNTPKSEFSSISVEQALAHPTWKMGRRITIDSATLMNKGFEVIEACRLFDLKPEQVKVLVHPQSTIHSMVEFVDGSILAQFSVTDMRLMDLRHIEFAPPDMEKFPCLALAYEAAGAGGAKSVALNAADEVAVAAFLDGRIRFDQITIVIEKVLNETKSVKLESIKRILEADAGARKAAQEKVQQLSNRSAGLRPSPALRGD